MDEVLADYRAAKLPPKLQTMLGFLDKLTRTPDALGPDDVTPLREVGLSDAAIEDAIHVCAAFNMIDRLADAFEFHIPGDQGFQAGARMLLSRGYRI